MVKNTLEIGNWNWDIMELELELELVIGNWGISKILVFIYDDSFLSRTVSTRHISSFFFSSSNMSDVSLSSCNNSFFRSV